MCEKYRDGEPCEHPGCLQHVTHPCEGCGRIQGRPQPYTDDEVADVHTCRFLLPPPGDDAVGRLLANIDVLRARCAALETENKQLTQWRDDLQSGMYINCVYCGHRYPPGSGAVMQEVLYEHIRTCPKHPLAAAEARIKELEGQVNTCYEETLATLARALKKLGLNGIMVALIKAAETGE